MSNSSAKPSVGLIGLAVMGSNLARNIESRGYPIAVFNRKTEVTDKFMKDFGPGKFVASKTLPEFVQSMAAPRQIILLIQAGPAVDEVMNQLIPLLSKGDVIIDGGNSYFKDSQRRDIRAREAGMHFLGLGVSGGEEGALKGPSLMPGGPRDAWKLVAPMLEKIAANVDGPCTTYIGPDGAGHFVKTVHNGIEYGDMQLIAEAYHLLRDVLKLQPDEMAGIFEEWNRGVLSSFLIEITGKVLRRKDDQGSGYLVDAILDKAGQKGTGKWTAMEALDLGVSIPTLTAAVDARVLSSMKNERVGASKVYSAPTVPSYQGSKEEFIKLAHGALYASKIISYAQGMALLGTASRQYKWDLQLGEIAAIWKGGCIIRARFLDEIRKAYKANAELSNLMLDPGIKKEVEGSIPALRRVVQLAAERGVPVPAFSASLSYFDSYRSADLPQNLTQGQRDFFGAHTFERKDRPGSFHAQWEAK
jgi:6-phosphogluconate dehydrogenase